MRITHESGEGSCCVCNQPIFKADSHETLRVMCRMTTFSLVTDENENLHVEPITTSAAFPASLPQKLEYLENLVVKEISFECNIGDVRREIANFGSALYNQLPLISDR